jgi:hypothetical protein
MAVADTNEKSYIGVPVNSLTGEQLVELLVDAFDNSKVLKGIEAGVKGLVIAYIAGDVKTTINMAKLQGKDPGLDPNFVSKLLKIYDEIANDFMDRYEEIKNENSEG